MLILVLVVSGPRSVFWTSADARRRITDPMLVPCATLPRCSRSWHIVYVIVRPPEYLDDVRSANSRSRRPRLASRSHADQLCPHCDYEVKRLPALPELPAQAQGPCRTCGKPLDPRWKICPYCEAEIGASLAVLHATAVPRGRRRTSRPRRSTCRPCRTEAAPQHYPPDRKGPMDRTLILVKPDAFARGLTGEIIAPLRGKGLKIVALRHMQVDEDLAKEHYAEHDGKPFFGELVEFITSGPLVAMVLEGDEAIKAARQVIGATNPLEAAPGSIRGDYAIEVGRTWSTARTRRSPASANRGIFFPGLILASASPQRRAILSSWASPSRTAGNVEEPHAGRAARASRWRTRAARPAAGRAARPRRRHRRWRSTARSSASRATPPQARDPLGAPRGPHPQVSAASYSAYGALVAHRRARPRSSAGRAATSTGTSAPGEWEGRAGGYAIQGRGAALVRASRATT